MQQIPPKEFELFLRYEARSQFKRTKKDVIKDINKTKDMEDLVKTLLEVHGKVFTMYTAYTEIALKDGSTPATAHITMGHNTHQTGCKVNLGLINEALEPINAGSFDIGIVFNDPNTDTISAVLAELKTEMSDYLAKRVWELLEEKK